MYTFKKFKHLDNNYMLVELNDKVKNNFLSSFLIGIDNKFLKLDTGDLNESTDYYKNKLNDKVMEKFDGKKFNKLNKKHLTYLADLCKMNLVIFDLNKLNLKFSTELNKKNKTVYLFKHGKKEYLLMKQNMRGMVSKLPVGIYEQFGGDNNSNFNNKYPSLVIPQQKSQLLQKKISTLIQPDFKPLSIVKTTLNDDDINLIEQINLVRLADTIYELNQIDIENKINFIVSLIYDKISDEIDKIDNINDEQRKDLEYETMLWLENNIIYNNLEIDDYVSETDDDDSDDDDTNSVESVETDNEQNVNPPMKGGINDKQNKSPYNRYEKSDYVHDFEKSRSNLLLHREFKETYDKILESIKGEIQNEDNIVDSLGLSSFSPENVQPQPYNDNGKMYSTEITSLEVYERIKHLPINKKIEEIFKEDTLEPKTDSFKKLIDKCKKIYDLIKENKCDYLQFDQGDTKKLLLETPISPDSTIGLTRLRNLPTLIDGAGSSKIDTIIENKTNTNNTNEQYWTEIYNNIFHIQNNPLPLTFSSVDYNRNINSSDGSSDGFKMILNNNEETIKNGFTVDNLKEVMCHITGVKNLQQDDDNEILNLVKNIEGDDNKLQILRKLKFIGDRGQIVSAMKDNDQNFTSRTLLGSGDRIFIAYALEQQEPIIFSNQFITRLYVPNILPDREQLESIEQTLLNPNISITYNGDIKKYADEIFEAFLNKNFKEISERIILSPIQITITNEEIKELIISSILSFINEQEQFSSNGYIIRFRNEIINVDKIQYDGSIISNSNYSNYLNTNIKEIIEFIIKVANSNTENTRKRKRKEDNNTEIRKKRLYQKLNELETRYLSGLFGTDRKTSIKNLDETEYNLFKIGVFGTIIEESNNIESEILKVLNENIKNLFDFKKKATESIEIIKSYKEEVKNALGENASRIMNETKLLEYIKKPENQ